ncbi:hypothetical protein [Sphingomonas sp. S2-65]|uniref:hypothetical protein n=1 Tax=Sphingomonas sp. S2-65 TaxID=2903960 RepID=UPI001F432C3D|nr:hypothetical protein [Sphingomonas sp. S2-65]UYY58018.1 hypothetical protein LZ586_15340 [Sphingomonas sp. S2-65]
MKHAIAALSVAALVAAAPASARQSPAASVMSFDVAGVRLNMPYRQVKAVLAGTYTCADEGKRVTFAEDLEDEVKRRRGERAIRWGGSGPGMLNCKGPNSEHLRIDFAQDREGPVVKILSLTVQTRIVAEGDLLRQLGTKFGRPTVGTMRTGAWCDAGYRCGTAVLMSEGPTFAVRTNGAIVDVSAARGARWDRARDAALQAEADRLAPKRRGAAL